MSSPLQLAIDNIAFARRYTLRLVDQIDEAEWFWMPDPAVSHVAWQVGHLAFAQYRLALDRIRGERPEDADFVSPEFLKIFGRDSAPDRDASKYPSVREIRTVFDRVHDRVMLELPALPESEWYAPTLKPHALFNRKLDALLWCSHHETIHAGQIGLLRRLMGKAPMW
jgi:hypothetical protein